MTDPEVVVEIKESGSRDILRKNRLDNERGAGLGVVYLSGTLERHREMRVLKGFSAGSTELFRYVLIVKQFRP